LPVPESAVVIGAGTAGSSAALQLAELGVKRVTVIDRQHPGEGSSGLSLGIFTRAYSDRQDLELRVFCHEFFGGLEADGLPLVRNGFLRLAHDDDALTQFAEGVRINQELGQTDVTLLSAGEIARRFPHIRTDDLAGGLYLKDDGNLDGPQLCAAYLERGVRLGVELRVRTEVLGADGGDGRPFTVRTSRGTIEADIVVNAAGAWAQQVGDLLETHIPVTPERHQVAIFRLPAPLGYEMPFVMDHVPGASGEGLCWRPEGPERLLASLHSNVPVGRRSDPDDFFRGADQAFLDGVVEMVLERLPKLEEMGLQGGWSGLYPMSPDAAPIIGETTRPGVFACAGLGGVGVYTSPIAGRLLAETVVHGAPRTVDVGDRFSPLRFALGAART
jgi:sarcosine oxidase subunit beta